MKFLWLFLALTGIYTFTGHVHPRPAPTNPAEFRDCADCPVMVEIPAGHFLMGSTEKELEHSKFKSDEIILERPQHEVSLPRFAVGKFDITKAEYAAFVRATHRQPTCGCAWPFLPNDTTKPWVLNRKANWNHVGFPQDSTHPVICVSFYDAHDYIAWLSNKTGRTYRLLTEAEWEYAARAGSTTAYPWGDSASHEYANYGADTSTGTRRAFGKDRWEYTSPAGSFSANAFGLYDMHGNVLQWVEDCVSDSYQSYNANGGAYTSEDTVHMKEPVFSFLNGRKACSLHMCRGGDFGDPPTLIRSASRNFADVTPDPADSYSSSGVGFRVALSL